MYIFVIMSHTIYTHPWNTAEPLIKAYLLRDRGKLQLVDDAEAVQDAWRLSLIISGGLVNMEIQPAN